MNKIFQKFCCILAVCSICFNYGCKRQKQVWFGAIQRTHSAEQANVVRLYIDKWGNLYPGNKYHIPYKAFFDPVKKKNTYRNSILNGNLEYYYQYQSAELQKLFKEYEIEANYNTSKDSFYAVQSSI